MKVDRVNPVASGPLGPEVLDREDVRQALAEHDFAAVFKLLKKWGGLTQNRIALACQLTPGKVSNIISGQQHVTSFDVISRIADGLRIPGHLIGLAPRSWETETPRTRAQTEEQSRDGVDAIPWRPDVTVDMATNLARDDLMMDRREAARNLTIAVIGGAELLEPLEGWLLPIATTDRPPRRGQLGLEEVEELETTTRAFRQWDHKYGGGLRRKAVIGQLSEVAAALQSHHAPAIEQRLYQVMAHLAGIAATMTWDSKLPYQAQRYHLLALRAAHAGNDRLFGANVLAGMARQMLYQDKPQDALELIRLAQEGTKGIAGPRVRAMLATREAWAFAAMGRGSAFQRATMQASEALSDAANGQEPYWIAYFDEAELAGVTGGRLLDMARKDPLRYAEAATDRIRRAIAVRGDDAGRSYALDRIGLAECRFLLGDLAGGVAEADLAVDAASRTRSDRVRSQLAELYPYTVGRNAPAGLREARDKIRDLLSSR